MTAVRVVFHVGLFAAFGMLVLAAASVVLPGTRELLGLRVLISYVVLGVGHVLLLGYLGQRLEVGLRPAMANWLYTAGFVHTLIALGTAVASAGAGIGSEGALTPAALGLLLAPMGVAIVPHAIGVWIGHAFEARQVDAVATIQESVLRRLADDANETRTVLKQLYEQRERALRNEIAALQRQLGLWEEMQSHLSDSLSGAVKQIQGVGTAANRLVTKLDASLQRLTAAFDGLATSTEGAKDAAAGVRKELGEAVGEAKVLGTAMRDTTQVVGDLKQLQASIVELLSAELFKR